MKIYKITEAREYLGVSINKVEIMADDIKSVKLVMEIRSDG